MRPSALRRLSMWDNPTFEHNPMLRYWKRMVNSTGTTLSSQSIPRHIHGYLEGVNPRTEAMLRWFPYKQELTVNSRYVPTFKDVLYAHYFPQEFNDDERVKYTAIKTGRSEVEIAEEIYLMRKIKLITAQLLRNKLHNSPFRIPEGADFSEIERRYSLGIIQVARAMGTSMYSTDTYEPLIMYSPYFDFGDCVDLIIHKQLRTSQQYLLCDIVVHKGISCSRLPHVKEDPKEPLKDLEPCLLQFIKLRLAVLCLMAKQEHYVVDHIFDPNHRYGGCLIHLFPSPLDHEVIDNEVEHIEVDTELATKWMKHYYDHYIAPRRVE
ncbi:unnamed protein product [Phytomonas sp. Hart1]|nr:unnamed protein product [Phytomonas sp. Hart1]|eukprot:CCW68180.1 unnamed protein product [Phytomonas sp. isolate Hart1]